MPAPHDEMFRRVFSRAAVAAAWLAENLPATLSERIDWQGLERLPDTFVRETGGGVRRSDLLFRVPLRISSARSRWLYLLPEHKSAADRFAPLQALSYVLLVFEAHRLEFPEDRFLPPVLSVLLRHGRGRGLQVTELQDLFELDDETRELLGPYLPGYSLLLDDLRQSEPGQLQSRAGPAIYRQALVALRVLARCGDVREQLRQLRPVLEAEAGRPGADEGLAAVLIYLAQVHELDAASLRELVAEELDERSEQAMASTYDQLLQEGLQKGLEQGLELGRRDGRVATLLELLAARFGALRPDVEERVRGATGEDLRRWTGRILEAASLEDVFS